MFLILVLSAIALALLVAKGPAKYRLHAYIGWVVLLVILIATGASLLTWAIVAICLFLGLRSAMQPARA